MQRMNSVTKSNLFMFYEMTIIYFCFYQKNAYFQYSLVELRSTDVSVTLTPWLCDTAELFNCFGLIQ